MAEYSLNKDQHFEWTIRGKQLFLIVEKKEFPVKTMAVMANGTQDLCIIKDHKDPSGYNFGSYFQEKPSPENLIWKPEGDIVIIGFYEKLPQSKGGMSILFLETKGIEPLLEEALRRNPAYTKNDLYDAFLGRQYDAGD